MFVKLVRLSVVLLAFSSLAMKEVQASSPQAVGIPSGKARYYPLARDYRQRILEKIQAPSRASARLLPLQIGQLAPSSFRHEATRTGPLFSGYAPLDLLMSLQP